MCRKSDSDWVTVRGHSRASTIILIAVWNWTTKYSGELAKKGTFQSVYAQIRKKWKETWGIGPLTCYDLAIYVCKQYKISLEGRVYLVGSGPKRAATLLGIWEKKQKCKETAEFYVMIADVRIAFRKSKYKYDLRKLRGNADDVESYMCGWQKVVNI